MKEKDYKAWFFIFGLLNDILIGYDLIDQKTQKIKYKNLNKLDGDNYVYRKSLVNLFKETQILLRTFKRKSIKYAEEIDDYLEFIFDNEPIDDGYIPDIVLVHFLEYNWFIKPLLIRGYVKIFTDNKELLLKSVSNQLNRTVIRNSFKFAENIKSYILENKKVDLHTQIAYVPSWAKSIRKDKK